MPRQQNIALWDLELWFFSLMARGWKLFLSRFVCAFKLLYPLPGGRRGTVWWFSQLCWGTTVWKSPPEKAKGSWWFFFLLFLLPSAELFVSHRAASISHKDAVRLWTCNFSFSLFLWITLRMCKHCRAFVTPAGAFTAQPRSSEICTPRKLKVKTLSTLCPLMCRDLVLLCVFKFTINYRIFF